MKAYIFGILILCSDNILRRLFPRFLVYSADYPEKYTLILLLLQAYANPDSMHQDATRLPSVSCPVPLSSVLYTQR